MPLKRHVEFLTQFAKSHYTGNEERDALLRLKLDHTLHVLENAKEIIARESIGEMLGLHCLLAALYHDIGRFPQFSQYGTFKDADSINHGRMGVLTLRSASLPNTDAPVDWRIVRFAIGQHNVKSIRTGINEPFATPTKLVRDADKVDILRVMVDHFSGRRTDPAITHGVKNIPDQYSSRIYEAVLNKRPGDYNDIKCTNDFKLMIIGWVYDLNFKSSIELINERSLIKEIFSYLPKDTKIQTLEESIDQFVRYNTASPS